MFRVGSSARELEGKSGGRRYEGNQKFPEVGKGRFTTETTERTEKARHKGKNDGQ